MNRADVTLSKNEKSGQVVVQPIYITFWLVSHGLWRAGRLMAGILKVIPYEELV
jgi:hypothetical protein